MSRRSWVVCCALLTCGLLALAGLFAFPPTPPPPPLPARAEPAPAEGEASAEQVHQFCGACHAYPPPDTFPRSAWRREVRQGFEFFAESRLSLEAPAQESVVQYYLRQAPEVLREQHHDPAASLPPVRFVQSSHDPGQSQTGPSVAHINLVRLLDPKRLDVLVCDMGRGQVLAWRPYTSPPAWQLLAEVPHPAHAEVVDLDADGRFDVLVADLGYLYPTDNRSGQVVWLRGAADGKFTPIPLLEGVGRVSDVQAADFDGDGDLDLVVAVFGWRKTGEILLLENRTADWSKPQFVPQVVDPRHGAIHVPVTDLDGDGRPDFVALISQEHETVVAFLNEGGGHFRPHTLYTAPHPAWGHSGIQLVDLDGDGDTDVLVSNGDSMDSFSELRPFHGVRWLENRGRLQFEPHLLTEMYGVLRALAADVDGDGDRDVVAVSFLPRDVFPTRATRRLDAVVLLEQTARGRFVRHSLETESCDHATCAVGDVYGDGRTHLVIGNFSLANSADKLDAIAVWQNGGLLSPMRERESSGRPKNRR